MEDVLQLYTNVYDPDYPLVCFDESSKQFIAETRKPLPAEPGQPERFDYEYQRLGVSNLFMFFEPLTGWRHVEVTDQRTQIDYAQQMKYLVDERYPQAKKIKIVQDNLNTHMGASLYKAFIPAEARRILDKLEFHYTPKHGSWLNMAEIELSVLTRQCLDRRIPDKNLLKQEVAAWEERRNQISCKADWQFTTVDARIKLKRLYPSISSWQTTSLAIGTAYSLPPIRLKRFPFWAALCIFSVRGAIVNLGLFLHFTWVFQGGKSLMPTPSVWALTVFILVFTFAIAIFKDIPDMEGDKQYNITTFTIQLGKPVVFNLARWVLTTCYLGMTLAGLLLLDSVNAVFLAIAHLVALGLMWWRSLSVDVQDKNAIAQYYQFIWKLFFLEYLIFPTACLLP